jgi:hypothetical protein
MGGDQTQAEPAVFVNHSVNDHSAAAASSDSLMAQIKPFVFKGAEIRSFAEILAEQANQPVEQVVRPLPPICRAFRDTGICQKGHDCRHRHVRPEQNDGKGNPKAPVAQSQPSSATKTAGPVQQKQRKARRSHLSETRHARLSSFFDNAKFVKKKVKKKKALARQQDPALSSNSFAPLVLSRQNSSAPAG